MQSNAESVDAYIAEASPERQPYLAAIRQLCREVLAGTSEAMAYGMAAYLRDGVAEVAFANQKQYISLYITKQGVVQANLPLLAGLNVGKGCIRYTSVKKIDLGVIRKLLEDTQASSEAPC